jgi:hypothetical protein
MTAHHKFELKGEHGFGKHVLLFSSSGSLDKLIFKDLIPKEWKFQYFELDLQDNLAELETKFMNTLHHYHYAKYLVLDFPAFILLSCSIHKILQAKHLFDKIFIFNPVKFRKDRFDLLFPFIKRNPYICLDGKIINVPDIYITQRKICEDQLHSLQSDHISIIGLQDKIEAFWLSSKIKNSEYLQVENYGEAIKYIVQNI